jgi:hypothetical protein
MRLSQIENRCRRTAPLDNSSTAVYSITSVGGGTSNELQWGSPVADDSRMTFTGKTYTNEPVNQTFDLGTLTYFNGSTDINSSIFGAYLSFSVGNGITPASTALNIATTVNDGTAAQNADFIGFSGLSQTFNVLENATASVDIYGYINNNAQLVIGGVSLNPGGGGYIANGGVPEPATWAIMLLGVGMVGFAARRRRPSAALAV